MKYKEIEIKTGYRFPMGMRGEQLGPNCYQFYIKIHSHWLNSDREYASKQGAISAAKRLIDKLELSQ